MVKVSFSPSDYSRSVADEASLILKNRYYEDNPSLSEAGTALIARPALKYWTTVGDGPIRGMGTEPGSFDGDLFVASGATLYRVEPDGSSTSVQTGLSDPDLGVVNIAITANIEAVPEYCFFCDGVNLYVYDGSSSSVVVVPDDVGVIDVAVVAGYVIVIPAQGFDIDGRFYWIEPGETTIDPLNFATAEFAPDAINGVKSLGDQFLLPGTKTTEMWYPTGDPDAPMQRLKGVLFDRGCWENTAVKLNENVFIVDPDGGVFIMSGGAPVRISNPGIEEQIRVAQTDQRRLS